MKLPPPIWLSLLIVALQLSGDLHWSALGLLLALLTARRWDPGALRFLGGKRFWLISFCVGAGAGLLLGRDPVSLWGLSLSTQGLMAGVVMVLRSAALLLALAFLARHLPRERFLSLSGQLGLAPLGPALGTAMDLLPGLQGEWRKTTRGGFRPQVLYAAVVDLLEQTAQIAAQSGSQIFFVTGRPGSGKTRLLCELSQIFPEAQGILQPRRPVEGSRDHYDVQEILGGRRRPIAGFGPQGVIFQEGAFQFAAEVIAASQGAPLVIIDELGHAEARGEGHWPAVETRLKGSPAIFLFTVARRRVEALSQRLPQLPKAILDLDDPHADLQSFKAQLYACLR